MPNLRVGDRDLAALLDFLSAHAEAADPQVSLESRIGPAGAEPINSQPSR
jgi:hypothetical protein